MKAVSLSRITLLALKTLGTLIRTARKENGISQASLAERLNVSRNTVISLEKGDPKVAIGIVFEAAFIVGVPLLTENKDQLQQLAKTVTQFNAILPQRTRNKKRPVDDNF